jgi:hypothetical protein
MQGEGTPGAMPALARAAWRVTGGRMDWDMEGKGFRPR